MGHSEGSPKREGIKGLPQETGKISNKSSKLIHKGLEKEQ